MRVLIWLVVASFCWSSTPVVAAPVVTKRSADIHFFKPALFSGGIFAVDRPDMLSTWQPSFKFFFNHASTPLRLTFPGTIGEEDVISNAQGFTLQGMFGITRWLELGVELPFVRHSLTSNVADDRVAGFERLTINDPATNVGFPEATVADVRVGLKATILDLDPFGLAVAVKGSLPLGDEELFAGEEGLTIQPELIAGLSIGSLALAVNVGYRFREQTIVLWDDPATTESAVPLLNMDDELTFGVGAVYMIHRIFGLGVEVNGAVPMTGGGTYDVETTTTEYDPSKCPASAPKNVPCEIKGPPRRVDLPGSTVMEALGGVIITPKTGLGIALGAGAGILGEERRVALRLFAGISWLPGAEAPVIGRQDRDNDGVPDDKDSCPDRAEDKDNHEDKDGCPDLDNDGDGLPDNKDTCPDKAEDRDGHEDKDGCPDLDNDGDGVPDTRDACPDKKEDKDGYKDDDGCPDEDNDGDGIADARDQCPNNAETKNNFQDGDGCPDDAPGAVSIAKGKIKIPQKIKFISGSATIERGSHNVLAEIAKKIQANPQVGQIRIEGHCDNTGKAQANQQLSQQRAESVRRHLVGKGVKPGRLIAVGYGDTRPVADNKTKAGRSKNRRVEFIVIETKK